MNKQTKTEGKSIFPALFSLVLLTLLGFLSGCQIDSQGESSQVENSAKPPAIETTHTLDTLPEKAEEPLLLSDGQISDVLKFYNTQLEAFGGHKSNCSDDIFDLFGKVARESENTFLDQFPVSVEDEVELGAKIHIEVQKEFSIDLQDARQTQLNTILTALVPHVERKGISYQIFLVREPLVNAFSIPGGYIYVTSGLMEFVDSEDELAFVIGHEVAHIDRKHCIRKYQKLALGEALLQDFGVMAANFQILLSSPFGQSDEYEADRYGATFAKEAGYDPYRGIDFFVKLKAEEVYSLLEKMLRSHPFSEERERCLNQYLDK